MTSEYVIKAKPQTLDDASAEARPLLEQAKANLGFVPAMYERMAIAPGVLDTYLHGYALFREKSGFTPAEQEVVFLVISRENACSYCMSAHGMLADKVSEVPADVQQALRGDQAIPDQKLAALADFTRVMFRKRGVPETTDVEAFLAAGYQERHILEIILALAVKTLSNYSNHVTHPELDEVFKDYAWNR